MIKEIEVNSVPYSITLSDDMVGPGLKKDENGVVSLDINEEKLVKITYSELKSLRDNSQLTPGSFYRITDYVTTTTQSETKSANHPFDVIVLALSENTLCEDAKAILHEGDTYFADSGLSAWELKYCLDNDKTRFEWADETNGKGVIYRMIDEKLNDCPYDFKNILFYNTKLTTYTTSDRYYYTFSYVVNNGLYDGTTEKQVDDGCYGNIIGEYIENSGALWLNNIVFRNTYFEGGCKTNTFGNNCNYNTFGHNCNYNTFGNYCSVNTFGNNCNHNTFGDSCGNNIFGNSCSKNIFMPGVTKISFKTYGISNEFGDSCNNISFGDNCNSNKFGSFCTKNTLGNNCHYNVFGSDHNNMTFGDLTINYKIEGSGTKKSVTTLSKEFYDDGTGNVVPLKHPDLSTEPSILPYKFMGEYVYEQIIPYSGGTQMNVTLSQSNLDNFIEAACIGKTTGVVEIVGYENNVLTIKQELPESVGYIRIVYTTSKYPITGQCGDNITYTLSKEGTLTINGSGSMYTDKTKLGYLEYKDEIINVIIYNSSIDSITEEAFAFCPNLENVEFI